MKISGKRLEIMLKALFSKFIFLESWMLQILLGHMYNWKERILKISSFKVEIMLFDRHGYTREELS